MSGHFALAVFVKTPGRSPVKTRLAASIGPAAALAVYQACLAAVASSVDAAARQEPRLRPHWAVAEAAARGAWSRSGWSTITQPEGGLGERLYDVQQQLLAAPGCSGLLFIGADSPQLEPRQLLAAIAALETHEAAVGPAEDGGFWLWAARQRLPLSAWRAVPWSSAGTLSGLRKVLPTRWRVAELDRLRDLDHVGDLAGLCRDLDALNQPNPEQTRLRSLLATLALTRPPPAR